MSFGSCVYQGLQDETVIGYKSKWECEFQAFLERFDVLWCSRYERTSEGFAFYFNATSIVMIWMFPQYKIKKRGFNGHAFL
jgi:hypothetical protein